MASTSTVSFQSTIKSKSHASQALQRLKEILQSFYTHLCAFGARVKRSARKLWNGDESEDHKVITHSASSWRAVRKCAIHFLPIAMTIILAGFNLGRYFIGDEFLGYDSGQWQDFDKLALQLSAKLYELLSVASIATILMDIIRQELLSSPGGLPLGILATKTLFVDARVLFTPEFRFGINGIKTKVKRYFLALFIAMCSILALLVGPSSALLLLPQTYSNWRAGGATFYLAGTNETIWPSQLDAQSIGGAHCQSPSESILSLQQLNMSSCVWSGYESIRQWWQSSHLAPNLADISIQDGSIQRSMYVKYYDLTAAAFGISLAPCAYAETLQFIWRHGIFHAPHATPGTLTKTANLRYRDRYGTTASMESQLPVVRTTCLTNNSVVFADSINRTYYPLQPEYPLDFIVSMKASGQPYQLDKVLGRQYTFNTPMYTNSSRIAAIWLETPVDQPIGTQVSGNGIIGRSSAYLNVQIPHFNSSTAGSLATCSIDARWVHSQILGTHVAEYWVDATYSAPDLGLHNTSIFPALNNGKWRTVRLGMNWLNTLTPEIDNIGYWNTLSSTLTSAGLLNNTGLVTNNSLSAVETIAAVVSTMVADGMSRSGYEKNGGIDNVTSVLPHREDSATWNSVVAGSYVFPFSFGSSDRNETNRFQMYWSVAVTGLGYRVNSVAYSLALAVLFTHVVLALGHIIWVLKTREVSSAWSSLTDMLVLALKSTPPDSTLFNTAAGVKRFKTFRDPVFIRTSCSHVQNGNAVLYNSSAASSKVEMIIGSVDHSPIDSRQTTIVVGQKY